MNKYLILLTVLFTSYRQTAVAQTASGDIVVTPYKTTMLANGKDKALINIGVIDRKGQAMPAADNVITFSIKGDAAIVSINGQAGPVTEAKLINGKLSVILQAGVNRGTIVFDATSPGLNKGSTEIHTVQPGKAHPVVMDMPIAPITSITDKIIGADISFLPQLESRDMKFFDRSGKQGDAMEILKANGFNYIRLRIFDHPEVRGGYSFQKGFCDLPHTLQMAKRIKAAGMKFLLDIHYSDTWADPQRQTKPAAWSNLPFTTLKDSVYTYTKSVMQALKNQGCVPDMVQVGNEINHGMLWPDGEINNLDSLANLIYAGIKGVKAVNPSTIIMLHIALGGQNEEARFFLDNMVSRKVPFDVIGLSYYPKWHGTLPDLQKNMTDLAARYKKYVMVAEYSQLKTEVNDISFTAPGNKALGTFIWEPLSTWESVFDRDGKANVFMDPYLPIATKYHVR
jgi:arabinogalactan endo-1,4-beta-galactosidase